MRQPPLVPAHNSVVAVRPREQAGARVIVLVLAAFLLGLGAAAFVFYRSAEPRAGASGSRAANEGLSEHTRSVLRNLDSAVEIRFYSLLDPASVPEAARDFAGRVDQLLSEYVNASGGKLTVTRHQSRSDEAANAASADGIKAFNLDKGEACFLGLTLTCNSRKESLPQLAPEWEQALEPDLTRALERVTTAPVPTAAAGAALKPDAAVIEEVKQSFPNLASVSVEEGTRVLREKALKTFGEATREIEAKVEEARQQLVQVQVNGSTEERQEALKKFHELQIQQTEKIKQIAARLQNQITALEYLKQK
jgi:uncharacterized membrane protein